MARSWQAPLSQLCSPTAPSAHLPVVYLMSPGQLLVHFLLEKASEAQKALYYLQNYVDVLFFSQIASKESGLTSQNLHNISHDILILR